MISRVRGKDPEAAQAALIELLQRYLPALRSFLRDTVSVPEQEVDDILQGFVLDRVILEELLSKAKQGRGRFRNYLMKVVKNYFLQTLRHRKAKVRSASGQQVELDANTSTSDSLQPDFLFDVAWARRIIELTTEQMRAECQASGMERVWDVFEARVLNPTLANKSPIAYEVLAREYGFESPIQAGNALITAKRMFARNLRVVVGEYVLEGDEIEEEILALRKILAASGA